MNECSIFTIVNSFCTHEDFLHFQSYLIYTPKNPDPWRANVDSGFLDDLKI